MQEKPTSSRRSRTYFSREQLRVLTDTFEKTRYPNWFIVNTLSSNIHLDESVIKTWFKNQRVKRRKKERETQQNPPLEDTPQVSPVKEEETLSPSASGNTRSMSLSISDASDPDSPQPSCAETCEGAAPCEGAAATPCDSSCDFLPEDLRQISFRDPDPPWASSPYDMDQLIQLYNLPGEDDPSSLDQYLLPLCST
ncbi:leucine-twenty homeobox [Sus scrofa]|uniref:leucine-twenty homeobox n=1 Tax=Sus scrofa TaxID=9823 RepID=UPI0006B1B9CA|nr:leucine-twenty homeobox [Sus scrofa]